MTSITLNSDQLREFEAAGDTIELRDEAGNVLGYVAKPLSAEIIATALQRSQSAGPWHTTQQVLDHLKSLEG